MMKEDISRNSFRPDKHFNSIRLQQGRVQLDADFNEQTDIHRHHSGVLRKDLSGADGVPLEGGGFNLLLDSDGKPALGAGRMYVSGRLLENENETPLSTQVDLPGATLPDTPGWYLAYLEVKERGITSLEDPQIRETALSGPDTALRNKTVWQARLRSLTGSDFHSKSLPAEWTALTDKQRGRFAARSRPDETSTEPCSSGMRGGYSLPENKLYRVEIHKPGPESGGTGGATYKWSRDNGILVTEWLEQNENQLIVRSTGYDDSLRFSPGQWLEITDDRLELENIPGTLAQVLRVEGETITVNPDNMIHFSEDVTALDINDFSHGRRKVRAWEMTGPLGEIPLPASNAWSSLEEGIEIQFDDEGGSRVYRTGDFWLIPARVALRNIEWNCDATDGPIPEEPHGNESFLTRLAFLSLDETGVWKVESDCRRIFPALTDVQLAFAGGASQSALPGTELSEALSVHVSRGRLPVQDEKVLFSLTSGGGGLAADSGGASSTTLLVRTDSEGLARCWWTLSPDRGLVNNTVVASLLNREDEVLFSLTFKAGASVAEAISYETSVATNDGSIISPPTVQEGMDELFRAKVNRAGDTITGDLTVKQNVVIEGTLSVTGDVLARDTEHIKGDVELGDEATDTVKVFGRLKGPDTGPLEIEDDAHLSGDLHVENRLSIGVAPKPGSLLDIKDLLRVTDEGYTGIGTDQPAARLHIRDTGAIDPLRVDAAVAGVGGRTFYMPFSVTNGGTEDLSDYQVLLSLDSAVLIAAGKLRPDLGDIRFLIRNSGEPDLYLNHWIEGGQNSDDTRIWLTLPALAASATQEVRMYYGNPNAVSSYPPTAVFQREISGVAGAWPLDENTGTEISDRSGNTNTGVFQGVPVWGPGRFNSALQFDGLNDGVLLPHSSSLNISESITLSAWFNCEGVGNGLDSDNYGALIAKDHSIGARSYALLFQHSNQKILMHLVEPDDTLHILESTTELEYAQTYHVIATYHRSSGTARIYINGVLDGETQDFGYMDIMQTTLPVSIGSLLNDPDGSSLRWFFKGTIDEPRIYNRALTASEATSLFENYGYVTTNLPGIELVRKITATEPGVVAGAEVADSATTEQPVITVRNQSGHVGVGVSNPQEKLSVEGIIESTSGGVKFPDGTVQTTAWSDTTGWTEGGGLVTTNAKVGIGTDDPDCDLSVAGKICADDLLIKNDVTIEGTLHLKDNIEYYDWELEHVIVRGIQGGGYSGSASHSLISHTIFSTETTSAIGVNLSGSKHYGVGVSGRTHGYFIGSTNALQSGGFIKHVDKFMHSSNIRISLGTPFTLGTVYVPYSFSNERLEKSYLGSDSGCTTQLKIDNLTDSQEANPANGWGNPTGTAPGGGFHDAAKGWANAGNLNTTMGFTFATETFSIINDSCRDGADGACFNHSLNTRKGLGYKIGGWSTNFLYQVDRFNFAVETWSRTSDAAYWVGECSWHGGQHKGYVSGAYMGASNYTANGAMMDYATESVVYAQQLNAPIARSSYSINNSGL